MINALEKELCVLSNKAKYIKENLDGFCKYYKDFLYLHKHKDNQRQIFEAKLPEYLNKTFNQLIIKKIIQNKNNY